MSQKTKRKSQKRQSPSIGKWLKRVEEKTCPKITDDPDWWNKAVRRGKRQNAFALALDKSFEHLAEQEQEKIFGCVNKANRTAATSRT